MIEGVLIDEKDVPKAVETTDWVSLLKKIPKGKALKITELTVKQTANLRNALSQHRRRERFKDYFVRSRTVEGERVVFIIHVEEVGR